MALTGAVRRQRRVTVPQPALRVPGAVLADPVRLADGLLDRQPHTDDARSRRLALTADGHRLHDLLSQAGADAERAWTDLVGAQTLQTVRAALAAFAHGPEPAAPATQVRLRFT